MFLLAKHFKNIIFLYFTSCLQGIARLARQGSNWNGGYNPRATLIANDALIQCVANEGVWSATFSAVPPADPFSMYDLSNCNNRNKPFQIISVYRSFQHSPALFDASKIASDVSAFPEAGLVEVLAVTLIFPSYLNK